ncbi:deoxyhypusine synthase [Candidatus Woesearchaeota archaeon]|nr:MAG: deoxyhypusine synthase [Candidatus Woesearchaeota archaeon]
MSVHKRYSDLDLFKKGKKSVGEVEQTVTLDGWPKVRGFDYERGGDLASFFASLGSSGFQATELFRAAEVVRKMKRARARVFFGFTSNMITSGVREAVTYLCKKKLVDVVVATAGGVEEDLIKVFKPFVLGHFDVPGKQLFDSGVMRAGNIFIPADRYLALERFTRPLLVQLFRKQREQNKPITPSQFCKEAGLALEGVDGCESSFVYWCAKNKIPIFCPALTDGSLGDLIYFFKKQEPSFAIDISDDVVAITDLALGAEQAGMVCLGGSVPKHHIANAFIFRDGGEFSVYITTAQEEDGSNAGANHQEAMTWGKLKTNGAFAKVVGDATILFPLLVASGAFAEEGGSS